MSSEDQVTWKKFVSIYAKTHSITFAQAMKDCSGPDGVWNKYKQENGLSAKGKEAAPKPVKEAAPKVEKEVKVKQVKKVKPKLVKNVKPPKEVKTVGKAKSNVSVPKPPKGKKMVITFVSESESDDECDNDEDEERLEVVEAD